MIEGLQVDVSGVEMKKLLESRVLYHREKADIYKAEAEKIRGLLQGAEGTREAMSKVSNSGTQDLEQSGRKHADQALFFKFAAEHIVVGEVYRLSKDDLYLLGITSSRY